MSGIALIWAANVKGLKPHTKIVLIQLADFHNKETGRCFPSAKALADECEMDRTTVFRHLSILEDRGLITRHSRGDGDGGRASNEYELHLDIVLGESARHKETSQKTTRGVVAESDGGSGAAPLGVVAERHGGSGTRATRVVAESDTNLNREPGREPDKRTSRASGADAPSFSDFWEAWPLKRTDRKKAEAAFKRLSAEKRRLATERAREWARAWRKQHPSASDLHPTTYLNGERWNDEFGTRAPPRRESDWRCGAVIPSQIAPAPLPPPKRKPERREAAE